MHEFTVFLFLLIVNSKEHSVYALTAKPGALPWRNSRNSLAHGSYNTTGELLINKI